MHLKNERYLLKALLLSIFIHAFLLLIIIIYRDKFITPTKPIVVDLRVEDAIKTEREPPVKKPSAAVSRAEGVRKAVPAPEAKEKPEQILPPLPLMPGDRVPALEALPPRKGIPEKMEKVPDVVEGIPKNGIVRRESPEELKKKYLKEQFLYIRERIQKNLSYPYSAKKMGWTGRVTVSFIVLENGDVENIRIIESSGFEVLDKNAIETIKKVSPFPKPPVRAELIMPIVYMLE
jgi:protein TonB